MPGPRTASPGCGLRDPERSAKYALAYDAVFNEPDSPWFKTFEDAVYSHNLDAGNPKRQSGINATLQSVKS